MVYQSGKTFNASVKRAKSEGQQLSSVDRSDAEHGDKPRRYSLQHHCGANRNPAPPVVRQPLSVRAGKSAGHGDDGLIARDCGAVFRHPLQDSVHQHPASAGMFDLGAFAKVYFLVSFAHGFRVWRRMMHPELEIHSQFEGPALPFFALLWKGTSFWVTRILWEPLFVVLASIALEDLFIIQHPLGLYLRFAALSAARRPLASRGCSRLKNRNLNPKKERPNETDRQAEEMGMDCRSRAPRHPLRPTLPDYDHARA
jgi:hypothetical protein